MCSYMGSWIKTFIWSNLEVMFLNSHPNYVCKLKKALYTLKQAPRAWYDKISQYLQFCDYQASNSDSNFFVKK